MNLQPEDPRLSAWLLGELSDEEAAEVQRAVAVDPALRMAVRDLERVQRVLSNSLAPDSVGLFPRQRSTVLLEARRIDNAKSKVVSVDFRPKRRISLFFPAAAAAVLVLACWFLVQLPSEPSGGTAEGRGQEPTLPSPTDRATWPSPAPGDAVISLPASAPVAGDLGFPILVPRKLVPAGEHPALRLPVQAGSSSLGWIRDSIRREGRLPSVHAVRLEEILNQFPLRPVGVTSVSGGVTLSAELTGCPWDDGSRLAVVSWRGAADASRAVTATFRPDPTAVSSYRLLGYARVVGGVNSELPKDLAAGKVHTVLLEFQPAGATGSLGEIEWTVGGQAAPVLPVTAEPGGSASADARFAGLVASFSLWLGGQSSALDGRILGQMVQEMRTFGLDPAQQNFLRLIDEAVALGTR